VSIQNGRGVKFLSGDGSADDGKNSRPDYRADAEGSQGHRTESLLETPLRFSESVISYRSTYSREAGWYPRHLRVIVPRDGVSSTEMEGASERRALVFNDERPQRLLALRLAAHIFFILRFSIRAHNRVVSWACLLSLLARCAFRCFAFFFA